MIFEDFENVTEWAMQSGTVANDSIFVKSRSASLKLTSTPGGNCIATKNINADLSNAGTTAVWVYIPNLADVLSLQVIFSPTTDYSKYFSQTITAVHEGWNKLLIPRSVWNNVGNASWTSPMLRLRVCVNAKPGATAVVYYDALEINHTARPQCIISFDDSWESAYTEGFLYMQTYLMPGVIYAVSNYLGEPGRMSIVQTEVVYAAGWDVANHTSDHPNLATLSQAEVETKLRVCADALKQHGWTRANKHVAYPFGGHNSTVVAACKAQGMLTGRTVIGRLQAPVLDHPYALTEYPVENTMSLATAKSKVDQAIEAGGLVHLNFHKLVSNPTESTEWAINDFRALIDYIQSNRSEIDVITISQWYEQYR